MRYPVRCTLAATLNNPIISREILGRSLRIRLDAKTDRPEQRAKFRHPNLEEYARENRAKLVGALLTLARAASGFDAKAPVLGGYETFSRRMAVVLRAIGVPDFSGIGLMTARFLPMKRRSSSSLKRGQTYSAQGK